MHHLPFAPSRGPVLAVTMGSNSEYCYSGGADARIHSWKIPDLNMDPYDGYGEDRPCPFPPLPALGSSTVELLVWFSSSGWGTGR